MEDKTIRKSSGVRDFKDNVLQRGENNPLSVWSGIKHSCDETLAPCQSKGYARC